MTKYINCAGTVSEHYRVRIGTLADPYRIDVGSKINLIRL